MATTIFFVQGFPEAAKTGSIVDDVFAHICISLDDIIDASLRLAKMKRAAICIYTRK